MKFIIYFSLITATSNLFATAGDINFRMSSENGATKVVCTTNMPDFKLSNNCKYNQYFRSLSPNAGEDILSDESNIDVENLPTSLATGNPYAYIAPNDPMWDGWGSSRSLQVIDHLDRSYDNAFNGDRLLFEFDESNRGEASLSQNIPTNGAVTGQISFDYFTRAGEEYSNFAILVDGVEYIRKMKIILVMT